MNEAEYQNEIERLRHGMESAWGVIANAYGGNWDLAPAIWKNAAERWKAEEWNPIVGKIADRPKKLLPDMGEIDKLVTMLQEAVSQFNDTRQYVDEALHTIQVLLDRLAGMDELRAYIQPQGPIQVVVPLKSQLPR